MNNNNKKNLVVNVEFLEYETGVTERLFVKATIDGDINGAWATITRTSSGWELSVPSIKLHLKHTSYESLVQTLIQHMGESYVAVLDYAVSTDSSGVTYVKTSRRQFHFAMRQVNARD